MSTPVLPAGRLSLAALTLVLTAAPGLVARAETFQPGALIVPMDTTNQDKGMFQAYGLLYRLLDEDVPVAWTIRPDKGFAAVDFTAQATDFVTGVALSHAYRGGPFVVRAVDTAAAEPVISAWLATHPDVRVHRAAATFDVDVSRDLVSPPTIGVFGDGNERIAWKYLNAAGIPDRYGNSWGPASPDVLNPDEIGGPIPLDPTDGALWLDVDGEDTVPAYCQVMSMHYGNGRMTTAVALETLEFLTWTTHAFMGCQAVTSFENYFDRGAGRFLTTNGIDPGADSEDVSYFGQDEPFAQSDAAYGKVGGSVAAFTPRPTSAYYSTNVIHVTKRTTGPGKDDIWMSGHVKNDPNNGKVSYLGGHEYDVALPISTNKKSRGVRYFLNSLFEAPCAAADGFPAWTVTKSGPALVATGAVFTYSVSACMAPEIGWAEDTILLDPLPPGVAFVGATNGAAYDSATHSVSLVAGNLAPGRCVTFDVTVRANGAGTVLENQACVRYVMGLSSPQTVCSNVVSTAVDPDRDSDGVSDSADNCPDVPNPGQENADGDALGDACDPCPLDPSNADADSDGACDDGNGSGGTGDDPCMPGELVGCDDNCRSVANPGQEDADDDGVGDACDNCPAVTNASQVDSDSDGLGNACDDCMDPSLDGDTVQDDCDNCPSVANEDQADADSDGLGDACDGCPLDSTNSDPDSDGLCDDGDGSGDPGDGPCTGGQTTGCDDNCPEVANPGQEDQDGDGIGDACDPCPLDPTNSDPDSDGACDDGDGSGDPGDGPCTGGQTTGCDDNCPEVANPDQEDQDGDGIGDACDPCPLDPTNSDPDSDGACDDGDGSGDPGDGPCTGGQTTGCDDNCPEVANPGQEDRDGDGLGDACDPCPDDPTNVDADSDGLCDDGNGDGTPGDDPCLPGEVGSCDDNCVDVANPGQEDEDGDGVGDACDPCPLDPENSDPDSDGACDDGDGSGDPGDGPCTGGETTGCDDNCPAVANAGQEDEDGDGVGDACDNCPDTPNPTQVDTDSDGLGNACDDCLAPSLDGDAVQDDCDNCPTVANDDQADGDSDGRGDECDDCSLNPSNRDADSDGVCDDGDGSGDPGDEPCTGGQIVGCDDNCPDVANPGQEDADGDGRGDECDPCPLDPFDRDADSDGACDDGDGSGDPGDDPCEDGETADCDDNCPAAYNPLQEDADGDGVGDACDPCPLDPVNLDADSDGACDDGDGSGTPGDDPCATGQSFGCDDNCADVANPTQEDRDGDGLGDACDPCPGDPANVDADSDGTCEDGDGSGTPGDFPCTGGETVDCDDNCPDVANPDQEDADGDGVGDACDPCPLDPTNVDTDSDGLCDATDDNCPLNPNPGQEDADSDGVGDVCDACPTVADPGQADADSDGAGDACDPCRLDPADADADSDGACDDGDGSGTPGDAPCATGQTTDCDDNCQGVSNPGQEDGDGDGQGDACDPCPFDPLDLDADSDSVCDDGDGSGTPGDFPCPDGTSDGCDDNCGGTPNADQADGDLDGHGDACDNCPVDPNADQVDTDSDGLGNACDTCLGPSLDGDAVPDDCDNCPDDANDGQEDMDSDGTGDACDACPGGPETQPPAPVGASLRVTGDGLLSWQASGTASHYPVHRGTIPHAGGMGSRAQPYDHACLDDATVPSYDDPSDPPMPDAYYYVVGAANGCGDSPEGVGADSFGAARPFTACP